MRRCRPAARSAASTSPRSSRASPTFARASCKTAASTSPALAAGSAGRRRFRSQTACASRSSPSARSFSAPSALPARGGSMGRVAAGHRREGPPAYAPPPAPPAPAPPRPVVPLFSVPATAPPGPPPRVALRIDERGVATVNVRVSVHDLSTRRAVAVLRLGWVRTARTVVVSWPRLIELAPGTYHVSLSANDHHGGNLLRRAHSSGVSTLKVLAPAAPAPAPVVGSSSPQAGVPTPAQTVSAGAVFPVAGAHSYGEAGNRFGAPRAGHVHEGQDVLTAEGTPVVAPLAGVIVTTAYQAAGAGYYVAEHTEMGLDFMFAHCRAQSVAVTAGAAVAARPPGGPGRP